MVFQRVLISVCGTTYRNWQNLWGLVCLHGKWCNCKRRNYLSNWSEETIKSSRNSHAEQAVFCVPRWQRGSFPTATGNIGTTSQRKIPMFLLTVLIFSNKPQQYVLFSWLADFHCLLYLNWVLSTNRSPGDDLKMCNSGDHFG